LSGEFHGDDTGGRATGSDRTDSGPIGGADPDGEATDEDSERGLLSDPRLTIARRDLASLSREKTIVLALLIQLFVAAFSSFLVVGLTSLYSPGSVAGGEIAIGVAGEHQDALVDAATEQEGVRTIRYPDEATARTAYQRGNVHAVMLARDSGERIRVQVIAPQESIQTTLIVDKVRSLLETAEESERRERSRSLSTLPATVPDTIDSSPYFGFTYTVLLPLLLFLPPFISGSVAVDALTEEIERKTLELLRVAPLSLVDIVDGKALGLVAIAPAQALLWLGLLWFNGITVSNVLPILVLVTALATMVVVLGLVLGIQTGQRRQAQLLYSILVIFGFGVLVFLPEHPATTVAKLGVDSATRLTYLHVGGYAVAAVVAYALARTITARTNPEGL